MTFVSALLAFQQLAVPPVTTRSSPWQPPAFRVISLACWDGGWESHDSTTNNIRQTVHLFSFRHWVARRMEVRNKHCHIVSWEFMWHLNHGETWADIAVGLKVLMFAIGSVIPICIWDEGSFSKFGCLEEMVAALTYFVCIGYLESPRPEHMAIFNRHITDTYGWTARKTLQDVVVCRKRVRLIFGDGGTSNNQRTSIESDRLPFRFGFFKVCPSELPTLFSFRRHLFTIRKFSSFQRTCVFKYCCVVTSTWKVGNEHTVITSISLTHAVWTVDAEVFTIRDAHFFCENFRIVLSVFSSMCSLYLEPLVLIITLSLIERVFRSMIWSCCLCITDSALRTRPDNVLLADTNWPTVAFNWTISEPSLSIWSSMIATGFSRPFILETYWCIVLSMPQRLRWSPSGGASGKACPSYMYAISFTSISNSGGLSEGSERLQSSARGVMTAGWPEPLVSAMPATAECDGTICDSLQFVTAARFVTT